MVEIRIKVDGKEVIIRKLSRVKTDVGKLNIPMERIASDFWKINNKNFEAQGQPKRFAPLSLQYKKWKDKNYPGKKIMQLKGRLKNSLTADNQEVSQDTIKVITRKYMELGTNVEYAAAHYYGYSPRNLPSRKIIQVTDKHIANWNMIIYRWANEVFRRVGFEVKENPSEVVA